MAKFNEDTAWTALTAPVDTDWLLVCDASADVVKIMDIQYLLVALDGDHLDVDFTPSYYTPATTPAEAADVDDLAAHLYGIDQKLSEVDNWGVEQSDTTFTVSSSDHYIEIDTSGGAVTATLPSAATLGAGWRYIFKVTDATAATSIATNGAETIESLSAFTLNFKNEILEIVSDGTNWKMIRWDLPIKPVRGQFAYADATSFTVTSAVYDLPTSVLGKVYWKGTLTLGPDTWAAGSSDITAVTGWYYVYLDQSAIDAGSGPEIADSHFIVMATGFEPTYSTAYMGWYYGNDRCLFAVRFSAASTLVEFFHGGGDAIFYADQVTDRSNADLDTTWTDVTLTIPDFAIEARCSFYTMSAGTQTNTTLSWRTNGQTGATGHRAGLSDYDAGGGVGKQQGEQQASSRVITDSGGIIEVRLSASGDNTAAVYTDGYYLPQGM